MFCETFDELDALPLDFTPAEYRVKWATLPWESNEAYALRRAVFCTTSTPSVLPARSTGTPRNE